TKLDHEIESYDNTTGEIQAWVKVPTVSSSTDTTIYIYYANSSITTSQENIAGVWDDGGANNFKMVQHLSEDPSTGAPQSIDSTQYNNDGTSAGTMLTEDQVAGQIDGSLDFDGTDDYVDMGNDGSLDITDEITISVWVKTIIGIQQSFVSSDDNNNRNFALQLKSGTFFANFYLFRGGSSAVSNLEGTTYIPDGEWHHIVGTFTSGNQKLYVDGIVEATGTGIGSIDTDPVSLTIGARENGMDRLTNGQIDEVRISNTARSADWIAIEYNNQSEPTEFYSLGIEEVQAPSNLSAWSYRKAITIDNTKVSGSSDLANFPVLINLPTDTNLATNAQADADDILFTTSSTNWATATQNDKLAHEIESYTSATGELQAWVKLPTLDYNDDTTIYMYYGNGSIASQQNPTVVWDSNHKMVQHLSEDPSTGAPQSIDSTQYSNDGTSGGTMTSGDQIAGKVNGSLDFDGMDDYVDAGNDASLDITDAITIEMWVNPSTINVRRYGMRKGDAFYLMTTESDGKVLFRFWDNLGNIKTTHGDVNTIIPALSWSHISAIYDGTYAKIYINGVEKYSSDADEGTTLNTVADYLRISANEFYGSMDEVRISNTARSADWIATEYNNQSTPTEFYFIGIEEVQAPSNLSAWSYRKAITIDNTKVSGSSDLTNFPVLINLPTDTNLATNAQADADDILFTTSSTNWATATQNDKLAHEIESYISATGELQAWVKFPTLDYNDDTIIYMYYGNATIASQQNPTAVWDSNHKMVQHLSEDPSTGAPQSIDSTQYSNDGTLGGTMTSGDQVAGKIDGSLDFDGTDDYVDAGNDGSLDITGSFTIETWFNPTIWNDGVNGEKTLVNKNDYNGGNQEGWIFGRRWSSSEGIEFVIKHGDGTTDGLGNVGNIEAMKGTWVHAVGVFNSGNYIKIYINGVEIGSDDSVQTSFVNTDIRNTRIGKRSDGGAYFQGSIDEVRISNTARSADWIATEYNNQSTPTEFYSLGIEEVQSPSNLSAWSYRKAITIDNTKVSGSSDLSNFPVLINLLTDTNLATNAQVDGDDILFTTSATSWSTANQNDKLAHEIENYTSATGELQAWVKLPTLDYNDDTTIYMYYGNATIASQQNPTVVWDSNHKMVQHLSEDPSTGAPQSIDSTQYSNDGTSAGSMTSGDQVAGQIDGSLDFDGTDDYVNAGNDASLDITGNISVSGWVYINNIDTEDVAFVSNIKYDSGFLGGFYLGEWYTSSTRRFIFQIGKSTEDTFVQAIDSTRNVSNYYNQWLYLTGVYNGTNVLLYLNGVQIKSSAYNGLNSSNVNDLVIGKHSYSSNYLNGTIDEVRVSNTARSADWIATEYNNQSQPTEFYFIGIEEVQSPSNLSAWSYRKAITIDNTKVSGSSDLTNFPVLINLPTDANLATNAQVDGDDILFTTSSTNWATATQNDKLAHEIESYTSVTGELQAWVKLPTLDYNDDTIIYMYYGNATITSQQNPTVVWDSNHKMVQHLSEDPSTGAPQSIDSTQYSNDGTSGGTMTSGDQVAGKIDGSLDFDGTDDYVDIETNGLDSLGSTSHTVELWAKMNGDGTENKYWTLIDKNTSGDGNKDIAHLWVNYTGNNQISLRVGNGTIQKQSSVFGDMSDNNWHHITMTHDGSRYYYLYFDGILATTLDAEEGWVQYTNTSYLRLGEWIAYHNHFNGQIDEVRISNTARSADWIATEYNNQSTPTEFYSIGIEEVQSPDNLSTWSYRKAITIDNNKVSGTSDLTNFPVLINLPTDTNLASNTQADADDILFTTSSTNWSTATQNDKLAHEIESYTSATGELQAWVKIPTLDYNDDTTIYMYYGNGSIASQQNPTVVWDSNHKMVQHLSEDPSTGAPQSIDSTQYSNDGTSNGTMTSGDQVAGQIDGSLDFDGTDDYVGISSISIDKDNGSFSFWVKTSADFSSNYGSNAMIIGTNSRYYDYIGLVGDGLGAYTLAGETNLNSEYFIIKSNVVSVGLWNNVVVSLNSGNVLTFLNGSLINEATITNDIIFSRIGAGITDTFYGGQIDEVRISNIARSADWILTEYNNQNSPSTFSALSSEQVYEVAITGTGTQTAGASQTITITAKDVLGSTITTFTGDKSVIFSGANDSPNSTTPTCSDKDSADIDFGSATTLTFTNGVATCDLKLYKAEVATITTDINDVTDTNLSVTVSPATLENFLVDAPASSDSGSAFSTTITSRDVYNNTTTTVTGDTTLTVNQSGIISPITITSANFSDDGIYTDNLTITNITEQPSATITATNGSSTGTDNISILGIPADPTSASASRNSDTQFTITWQDNSTVESGYKIERKTDTGSGFGAYSQIGTASADATSFVDNSTNNPADPPQADERYQYQLRAYNTIGNSAGYSEDSVIHYTTAGTPSNITGTYASDTQFSVSYTDTASVEDTHRIQRCSNANCTVTYETDLGTFESSPQTDSTSVFANSRYRWQARSETPDSLYSAYASSNYEYTTPTAPIIGTPAFVSNTEITVNWTDNSDYEDGFRIEVSIDGGAYAEITPGANTVGANIESYAYTSTANHNYKFKIRSHVGSTVTNSELLSAYSDESTEIYTTASSPTIGTSTADSSTAMTFNWTDNSAFEESFRLDFTTGNGTNVDDITADLETYQVTGLTPNTQYAVHIHSYRSDTGESDASASSSALYTLANIPSSLSFVADSITQITASWNANSNPAGTEYYIQNATEGTNSGWIADTSWISSSLGCSTFYSFQIKSRNGDLVETAYTTLTSSSTQACAVLPPGISNPPAEPEPTPENPIADFTVVINNDDKYSNSKTVNLKFNAGSDTARVAVSNTEDFIGAAQVPYQEEIEWALSEDCFDGRDAAVLRLYEACSVYTKFYTKYGVASKIVSDDIILDTQVPELIIGTEQDLYNQGESILIYGTSEPFAQITFNLNDNFISTDSVDNNGYWSIRLDDLSLGLYNLVVTAVDEAGNENSSLVIFSVNEILKDELRDDQDKVRDDEDEILKDEFQDDENEITEDELRDDEIKEDANDVNEILKDEVQDDQNEILKDKFQTEEIISQIAPDSMQGNWDLVSLKTMPSSLSQDIVMITEKFPKLKSTFEKLGIDKMEDIDRLQSAKFTLSQPQEDEEIPTEIVFAKAIENKIKLGINLTINKKGNTEQAIYVVSGQDIKLSVKPEHEAKDVQGYLVLKSNGKQEASEMRSLLEKIKSLSSISQAQANTNMQEEFVVQKFDYEGPDENGIYSTSIQAPKVKGQYEIITVIDYEDETLGSKELRLITVVDPEGYVYRVESDGAKARIPGVIVSIYELNSETNQYELWQARDYEQVNPQTTDDTGEYSFLVPEGTYYLTAQADDYLSYQGDHFNVREGEGIHFNIELQKQENLLEKYGFSLIIFVTILFIAIVEGRRFRVVKKRN
ncbi:MAG: DUF2341 domain-containing protein, partial [Candidatus Pacebacteria bacterium]|nr:DUF2341 domain-containing protein [Candidatus Paceibacterota bacterium]